MALTAIIEEHGGPDRFKLVDLDVGEPQNGEVRIVHKAIGLNFIDVTNAPDFTQCSCPMQWAWKPQE